MRESIVYVYKTTPKTLQGDVKMVLNTPDFQKIDPKKETFIKINANYDRNWPGCNTSSWFLDALLKNLREMGFGELTVIEGDLKMQPAKNTIAKIGIDKILARYDVPFLPIENLARAQELPTILQNAQIVSTPVLHTHTFAVISVASKNLYGLLPIYREKYHRVLSEKLLELVNQVKAFSIVDGTVGVEGGSMRLGDPKRSDLILGGWDPIAIDMVAAKVMGFPIVAVPHLNYVLSKEGMISPLVKGDFSEDDLPHHHFTYKRSALSDLDLIIRRNKITGRLFEFNSLFDKLGNHMRRMYTGHVYSSRKEHVCDGDWREYEREYKKSADDSLCNVK